MRAILASSTRCDGEKANLLGILDYFDHQAFRLRKARLTIRDLHGPWSSEGPCWPTPYRHPIDSPGMAGALESPVREASTERWEHGCLVEVASQERLEELRDRWGVERTMSAAVGEVETLPINESDRAAMVRFCERGWLRSLVQAFEHVGAKASHVGFGDERLREQGTLGVALIQARRRHRLAVLEDLLASRGGDGHRLFAELDVLDQLLDGGLGESWLMAQLPVHCASLWPLRNLVRMADRRGVILRDISWQEYENESSYAPEVPVLALEPRIYGAGVEHDITHYLEPIFWTDDRLLFEVANNGIEGDGQAMNNLILSSRYSGPAYEGFAGWPGGQLFEWLERAFQVATFPQMFGALRMFTIVMHQGFDGDPVAKLRELAPGVKESDHLNDLLGFFPEYVQHDHDFLGVLHARYVTPFYDLWREHVNSRLTFDLEVHVQTADDFLWDHQDVDLRYWWHPAIGRVGCAKARCRHLWTRVLELKHLVDESPGLKRFTEEVGACLLSCAQLDDALSVSASGLEDLTLQIAPADRDAEALATWSASFDELAETVERIALETKRLADSLRGPVQTEATLKVEIPRDFQDSFVDLFSGVYYQPAVHQGTDLEPSGVSLDGARVLLDP
jgi:hypothetical protein